MCHSAKQKKFVEEYLVDLNATQAAIRAGYSKKTAKEQAARLLTNVNLQSAIQKALENRSKRTEITQDMVIKELAKLGFSNILDYVNVQSDGLAYMDLSQLSREQAAAIQEMTVDEYVEGIGEDARLVKKVKIKLADKRASLETLGKHLGMVVEKHEHSGPGGGPIQTVTYSPEQLAELDAKELAKLHTEEIRKSQAT